MNSGMIKKYLGSLIRGLLAGVLPFLVANGVSEADSQQFITILAGLVVALVWSIWEKRYSRKETLMAAAMPGPSSLAEVKAKVADGLAPSVDTPVDAVPKMATVA